MKKSLLAAAMVAAAGAAPLLAQAAVVVRDADTGQLRAPTAAEAAALRAKGSKAAVAGRSSAKASAESAQRVGADGSVEMDVPEELMQYSVVRQNADGSLSRVCVQGDEGAREAALKPAFAKPIGHSRTVAASSTARTARGMHYEER